MEFGAFEEDRDQVLTKHDNEESQHTPANRVKTRTRLYIQHFTIYIQMATEHSPTKKADRNADDYMSVQNSIT